MKATGIIRRMDELGRIVLPIELRRTLNIADRDPLEIYLEADRIILHKYENPESCVFCGTKDNLVMNRNKYACRKCLAEMLK